MFNDGKPLTLLEKSDAFKRLINYGWSEAEIAKKVGKSLAHVKDCLVLATASTALKNRIIEGSVSATVVLEGLKNGESKEIEGKIDTVVNNRKRRVVSSDLGNAPKSFSVPKFRKLYVELEEMADTNDDINLDKLDAVEAILKYIECSISKEELIRKMGYE